MKLSRLLVSLISLLWVLVFIATLAIVIQSTRDYLQKSMESHAQDTATSLGLSITHSGRVKDVETVERMTAAIFDRGYYSEILIKSMDGKELVAKRVEQAVRGVPAWFINAFPLATPRMDAIIMDGWRQAGVIEVVSHPGHAYAELWRVSVRSGWVLLIVAIASLIVVIVVLRLALRPLDDMEQQAINISNRQFTVLEKLPWARELHRVTIALNSMCVAVERMLGEQTALTERMRRKAYVDGVTGLMNRNDFSERLAHMVGTPEEFGAGALAIIRLRGFLSYNERNGRPAGDALLQRTAQLLGTICDSREGAILARLDGPEFAMLVPDIAESDLPALGEKIITGLGAIEEFPRTETSVMPHVGLAYHQHQEGASFGKLMTAVNAALGVAQARGVPAWHVQERAETADKTAALSAQIHNLLKSALTSEQIVVQYQPVRPCHVDESAWRYRSEAWARIVGADGSLVPAGLFMPVAKRLGVLEQLDRLIVEKIMRHIAAQGPIRGGATAVNVSQESILNPAFVEWLHGQLAGQRAVARHIIVEVSEQSIINKVESVKTAFHRLRETGASCSIDRFGQSTASVGFLRSLEIDYIKIDGSYTRGIVESTDRQFFVQALVGIAHGLGIQVLTEYIETEQDFEMVKGLMVDGAQGYFIGKPE
jgi:diguanylate cyclase (GGDEF)-like protein